MTPLTVLLGAAVCCVWCWGLVRAEAANSSSESLSLTKVSTTSSSSPSASGMVTASTSTSAFPTGTDTSLSISLSQSTRTPIVFTLTSLTPLHSQSSSASQSHDWTATGQTQTPSRTSSRSVTAEGSMSASPSMHSPSMSKSSSSFRSSTRSASWTGEPSRTIGTLSQTRAITNTRRVTPSSTEPTPTRSVATASLSPSPVATMTISVSKSTSLSQKSESNQPTSSCSATNSAGNLSNTRRETPTLPSDSISLSPGTHSMSASQSGERSLSVGSHSMTVTVSRSRSASVSAALASMTMTATTTLTLSSPPSVSESSSADGPTSSVSATQSVWMITATWSATESLVVIPSHSGESPSSTTSEDVTPSKSSSDVFVDVFKMGAVQEVAVTIGAVASLGIVAVGGMSPSARSDASVQVLLMQVSSCKSRDVDLTVSEMQEYRSQNGGRSIYGLNPFWDYGFLIAAYSNIAMMAVFFWLYGGVILFFSERAYHDGIAAAIRMSYGAKSEAEVDEEQEAAQMKRRGIFREWRRTTIEVAQQGRFPAVPLRVVEVLLPGTMFCSVGFLLTSSKDTSGLPAGVAIAFVLGILLGFVGYLHVRIAPTLRYVPVHHPLLIPDAVSPYRRRLWIARLIPTHRWEPSILRAPFGCLYDSMSEEYLRYRVVDMGLVLSYAGMSAMSTFGTGLSCVVGCGWMTLSMAIAAVMTATHGLYRLPLDRVITPVKHILFAVICCLKTVGSDVHPALTYAQFGLIILRVLYGVWVKREEQRIIDIEAALANPMDLRGEEWSSIASSSDDVAVALPEAGRTTILELSSSSSDDDNSPKPHKPPPPPMNRARVQVFDDGEDAAIWGVL